MGTVLFGQPPGRNDPSLVCHQEGRIMRTGPFDTVTRHAGAAVSRRTSLLSLGGAAMLAGASASGISVAKKKNKGNTCKDKEKKRCNNDAQACRNTVATYCAIAECDPANALALQACCDTCSVDGFITCQIALTQS